TSRHKFRRQQSNTRHGIGSPGNAALELSETVVVIPQLFLPRLIPGLIDALWWDDFRTRDECIVRRKHTQCAHLLCDRSPVTLDAANGCFGGIMRALATSELYVGSTLIVSPYVECTSIPCQYSIV